MTELLFRRAEEKDAAVIWEILQDAIALRKSEGSEQWQNGYPNEQTVAEDLASQSGYLLIDEDVPVAYAAIVFEDEPAYAQIDGAWLTDGPYAVVHRVARSAAATTKGVAERVYRFTEELCAEKGINSIRVDTNFDNAAMLNVLRKCGYVYCGEIFYQGAPRMAFEKVLSSHD